MEGFSVVITCFYMVKEVFDTSGMFNELQPLVTWEDWERQTAYMEFWGETVLNSSCIKSPQFGGAFHPMYAIRDFKICVVLLLLDLPQ